MTNWLVVRCCWGEQGKYLSQGWEPFAVSTDPAHYESIGGGYRVACDSVHYLWLRKVVSPKNGE